MTATPTAAYRIKGTTGDVTDCEACGRRGLRKTVALAPLDADGNECDAVYYGVDCAARALGRLWTAVRDEAAAADGKRTRELPTAHDILAVYGPVENAGVREKAALYYSRNPHMRDRGVKATEEIARMLAWARSVVAPI